MKKLIFSLAVLCLLAFKIADLFSDLGMTKSQTEESIANSITNGYLNYPSGLRKIALANRVSVIQAIGAFTKSYTQTDDFKKRYAEWWKNQEPSKPDSPELKAAAQKQQAEEQKKELAKSLDEMKKQIAALKDPAMKKQMQQVLDMTVQMQAQANSPEGQKSTKETQELMQKLDAEEYKTKYAEYQEKFTAWQELKNPNVMIKKDLQKFLEASDNVDFEAKLKTNASGLKQFVNEDYESKDNNWKAAFRAGKPATEAARTIAKDLLKSL